MLDLFVGGFGALWVPLGSLLGSLEALLGGLLTQKPSKTCGFLRFLKRLFEAPDGLLGLTFFFVQIWAKIAGPIWVLKLALQKKLSSKTGLPKKNTLKNPLKINKSPKKSLRPGPFGEMGPSKKGYFEDAFKIA